MGIVRTFDTHRLPLKETNTVTVGAGITADVEIIVPAEDLYFLNTVTVTVGVDTVVNDISIDRVSTGEVTTFTTSNVFGDMLSAWERVTVNVTNNGTAGQDTTLAVVGFVNRGIR